ncbi:MAG: 5-formyltetrahydrofolate cyclo-ligase [Hyphomicrobiales bacterium]
MTSSQAIEKEAVRQACLDRRNQISPGERKEASLQICKHALQYLNIHNLVKDTQVSAYLPIRSEVDLGWLLPKLHIAGAQLSLPVVLDKTTIIFRAYAPGEPLQIAGFGTSGPSEKSAIIDPVVLLMPLAGFDRNGARIGYGAGHYDRAIQRLLNKNIVPIPIGIAFSAQEVSAVPSEPHDMPLSAIITEVGIHEPEELNS